MKKLLFPILMIIITTTIAFAEEETPIQKLLYAKTIKCYLDKGAMGNWSKGKLNIDIDKYSTSEEGSYIIFDSIDIKNGKARLIANIGATDVAVIATASGLTFIEQTGSGNLSFATIFPLKDKNNDKYLCVQSRHIYIPKKAMPQQYYGTCEILEYNY